MSTKALSLLVVSIGLSLSSVAAADAVPPEPTDCPPGSIGATCHGGPFCRPDSCDTRDDCDPGEVCVDTPSCISTIDCGGIGGPAPTDAFEGLCETGTCETGTCETRRLCVPEGGATVASSAAATTGAGASTSVSGGSTGEGGNGEGSTRVDQGCSCEVVGGRATSPWWLLAGSLLVWPLRRRRR